MSNTWLIKLNIGDDAPGAYAVKVPAAPGAWDGQTIDARGPYRSTSGGKAPPSVRLAPGDFLYGFAHKTGAGRNGVRHGAGLGLTFTAIADQVIPTGRREKSHSDEVERIVLRETRPLIIDTCGRPRTLEAWVFSQFEPERSSVVWEAIRSLPRGGGRNHHYARLWIDSSAHLDEWRAHVAWLAQTLADRREDAARTYL